MKKYNIDFTLVIVDKISSEHHKIISENTNTFITKGEMGCCISHLWCLYQIIKNNYENAIIFEDDIILHKNFTNEFLNTYENMHKDNNTLDFLLLGAHDFNFSKSNYKNVKNKLYRPNENTNNLYGAHANYYSLKGAKAMFKIRTSEISFFDKEYMLMFKHFKDTSYVCYPNLVVSNVTSSTLNHKREILSQNEYEYYNKCFIKFTFNNYNFIYLNLIVKNLLIQFMNSNNITLDSSTNTPTKEHQILNLAGCKIDESHDYESFIDNCLYHKFYDLSKINMIKKRFVVDFFTLYDMKMIFSP
jgi:GR25 family glycosyltransferase involved in LPS biosynthesis